VDGVGGRPEPEVRTVARVQNWVPVVEAATRAPSIHNTQPWRFTAAPDRLEVFLDTSRELPTLDPTRRQQVISCGVAVEFALVALRSAGHEAEAEVGAAEDDDLLATVVVTGPHEPTGADQALAAAIVERHTRRAPFLPRAVPGELLGQLQEAARPYGVWVQQVDQTDAELVLAHLLDRAERAEQADPAYRAELESWLRTDPAAPDGIPVEAVPGDDPAARPTNWAVRDFLVGRRTPEPAVPVADDDPPPPVERPAVVLMGTAGDDRSAWVQAGRALGRVLLVLTAAGMAASPLTQALDWPATRTRMQLDLSLVGHPQMLMRIGWSSALPTRTGRRPVAEVLRTVD
jgi:hypothetical protein